MRFGQPSGGHRRGLSRRRPRSLRRDRRSPRRRRGLRRPPDRPRCSRGAETRPPHSTMSGSAISSSPPVQPRISLGDHVLDRNVEIGAAVEFGQVLVDVHGQPEFLGGGRGGLPGPLQPAAGDRYAPATAPSRRRPPGPARTRFSESGVGLDHALDPVRQTVPDQRHFYDLLIGAPRSPPRPWVRRLPQPRRCRAGPA